MTSYVPLGDIVDIKGGGTPDKKVAAFWDGDIPWASVKDFKSGTLDKTVDRITAAGVAGSATNIIPAGHIIVPTRMAVGKAAINSIDMAINQDLKALFPKVEVDTRYLYNALLANSGKLLEQATGATVKGIKLDALRGLKIPLPPLEEQKRIAGILDQADALRRLRTRALEKLNTLGQAIFHEMFGDKIEPKSVQKLLEDKVLLVHKDGNHGSNYPRKEEFGPSGVPFLSAKVIDENGQLIASAVEYLNEAKAKTLKIGWIEAGDVLLSHNASVGKVVSYRGEYGPALIGTSLTCYRPNPSMLRSDFLEFALKSFDFQAQLSSNMSQTTRNQVPITAQKRLALTIPSMGDQIKFENRVASILTATSSQKKAANAQGALFASLQHRAFRGEL